MAARAQNKSFQAHLLKILPVGLLATPVAIGTVLATTGALALTIRSSRPAA